MKNIAMLAVAITAMALTSCGFDGERLLLPGVNLPVQVGLSYELEDGLFVQVTPGDKGGLEIELIGEGELTDSVRKIPGGWEIEGPSGLVYRITSGPNGTPVITVIRGTGRIRPVPYNDEEDPIDVDGQPDPEIIIED